MLRLQNSIGENIKAARKAAFIVDSQADVKFDARTSNRR